MTAMPGNPVSAVAFDQVSISFAAAATQAGLEDVSFEVKEGSFVSVIGPSGCGKTTVLNLSAGLLHPDSGYVLFRGEPLMGVNTRAGYVTQDANLLPWLNVFDNISLPLKVRKVPVSQRRALVTDWIARVGLEGFERHFPRELSGGMQKRCAIARTMVYDPDVVLMDEPFGPLDAITRMTLQNELLRIWQITGKTIIFVTHDLGEAVALSTDVVVMTRGPGRIKLRMPIQLPSNRDILALNDIPEYAAQCASLWERFRQEIE